jgi:hypothetical protein
MKLERKTRKEESKKIVGIREEREREREREREERMKGE